MSKKIMFQGTGSSVGKSILVTAVCRILNNRGQKVAPFKSQNMALNSFVTKEGLEMGRAQVVQAEAARIEPDVRMNPILLKPTSDVGSQVILHGRVKDNMRASAYFSIKNELAPEVVKAFKSLEESYETIVIEGAGSPAEINLRSRDIVNMGLAEMVDTDVILVGDVDRGGVFAALYGTYALLSDSEQKRVKGFVINKFRGDVSLLMPGVEMLEEKIGIPCLGVIPYIQNINIDDEDSVASRLTDRQYEGVKIGVVRLPYMSNFSDFNCFDFHQDVSLNYVTATDDLLDYDLLVIPGSKNTLVDMKHLVDSGMAQAIYRAHRKKIPIIGICGGYQILGKKLHDPFAVESGLKTINGLGLLDVETTMYEEKRTVQSTTTLTNDFLGMGLVEASVKGYEIHMGKTKALSEEAVPFLLNAEGEVDGHVDAEGMVVGTYLHGIFDNDAFRNALIKKLRGSGAADESLSFEEMKVQAYDRLVEIVQPHLDMQKLDSILNESRQTP
ncbi:cobyric acid synthase [Fusibacter sp. JL298sf-3]